MYPNRRTAMLGGAAAMVGGSALAAQWHDVAKIPSTGVTVPSIGLGSWIVFNVGDDPALLEARADVIAAFVQEGGGMIDSSPMYGSAQSTIRYGLAKLATRDVFSADKVWTRSVAGGPDQIAETAVNWGVERFDLLQVHNLVSWQGHLETLHEMKQAGTLGHVGVTTSHGRRHDELEQILRTQPLDFVQLTYNPVDREAEARLLPMAQERGVAVIVNRPFRRGALTQRLEGRPLPGFAADLGAKTWAQLILKFVLSHPAVTVAIPATTQVAHVRENKQAARGAMPDDTLRARIAKEIADL